MFYWSVTLIDMKTAEFLKLSATLLGLEPKTVDIVGRNLKAEGLMSSGARGVNAPDMGPSDLSALLVALLGTDKPARAVEMVKYFGGFQLLSEEAYAKAAVLLDRPNHTFLEMVTAVCEPSFDPDSDIDLRFEIHGMQWAKVSTQHASVIYMPLGEFRSVRLIEAADRILAGSASLEDAEAMVESKLYDGWLTTSRSVSYRTIRMIKKIAFRPSGQSLEDWLETRRNAKAE